MALFKKKKAVENQDITNGEVMAYGLGGVPATMGTDLKNSYHMAFLTEVAGIPASFVGLWSTIITIWDAANDPIIGRIADRTNTKYGKYVPHMAWGIILLTITSILLYYIPDIGETGKKIYYVVLMFLWTIGCTAFMVPWQSLNSMITTDVGQRNRLLTYRMIFGTLSATILGVMLVPVVNAVDGGRWGYFTVAVITALLCLVCGIASIWGAKKKDYQGSIPTPPSTPILQQMKEMITNRAVVCVALMLAFNTLINTISTTLTIYYFTYVVGNMGLITIISLVSMVLAFATPPLTNWLFKLMGRHKAFIVSVLVMNISTVLLMVMRENLSTLGIILGNTAFTTGFCVINMTIVAFVPDAVDYTELNYGSPQAGVINAIVNFVKQGFSSLATLITGMMLTAVGYVEGGQAEATPELINGILNLKIYSALILSILAVGALAMFPITKKYGEEMRAKLKEIRAARAASGKE